MQSTEPPQPALALACINIERSKHIPSVTAFLEARQLDVICLQEVVPDDLAGLSLRLGFPNSLYVPMCLYREPNAVRPVGLGLLSRHPFERTETVPYAGLGSGLDVSEEASEEGKYRANRYSVALATIVLAGTTFHIGTTHFPWTNFARTRDFQREACDSLVRLMKGRELVLCGDFNAPRGGEIFARLAGCWTDNIPAAYSSSLDPKLHRAGHLERMVNGIFSTRAYRVDEVRLHTGVSDHCAITAHIRADNARERL
jgi:endonuclease/exonuclease/phosphatase family metal-dependent hydrolase